MRRLQDLQRRGLRLHALYETKHVTQNTQHHSKAFAAPSARNSSERMNKLTGQAEMPGARCLGHFIAE